MVCRPERILQGLPGRHYRNSLRHGAGARAGDHHLFGANTATPTTADRTASPSAMTSTRSGPPRPDHQRHHLGSPRCRHGRPTRGPRRWTGRPEGPSRARRGRPQPALRRGRTAPAASRAHRREARLRHRAGDLGCHGRPRRRCRVGLRGARRQRGAGHAGAGSALTSLPAAARERHPGYGASGAAGARRRGWPGGPRRLRALARRARRGRGRCPRERPPGMGRASRRERQRRRPGGAGAAARLGT